jgi:hypothetical protein
MDISKPVYNSLNILTFECPHCLDYIQVNVNDLNCMIFRHAVHKESFNQINPHASKIECENHIQLNDVYGCSKPFKITINHLNIYSISKCDYI